MKLILLIFGIYLFVMFLLQYIFAYIKETKNTKKENFGESFLSPSRKIVDAVGGGNNASPISDLLRFIEERRDEEQFSLKGDSHE